MPRPFSFVSLFALVAIACAGRRAEPAAPPSPSPSPASPPSDRAAPVDAVGPPCEPPDVVPSVMSKTDRGLYERYREHRLAAEKSPDDAIAVNLRFCGPLAPILALGLEQNGPVWETGSVGVIVKFDDLERIVHHPGVVQLSAGTEPDID